MKTIFYIGLMCLFLLKMGCCNCDTSTRENRLLNIENRHISSETAILIAKGQLFSDKASADFGVTVKETPDGMEVHFSSNCKGCVDGNPYVVINKMSGEVVRVFRYGKPSDK
jgi:hypothetical protein